LQTKFIFECNYFNMETSETELTPADSLKLITGVIAKTQADIKAQSFCFLLWGWLIAIASLSFYILHQIGFDLYFIPFPILVLIGIIITVVDYSRNNYKSETYLGGFLKQLWLVLGISFIVVVLISLLEHYPPFTYTMLIGGIGTLVSGLVMRFKPLTLGGAIFLVLAIVSVFASDNNKPLVQCIAIIAGYLIPGYLLKYSG